MNSLSKAIKNILGKEISTNKDIKVEMSMTFSISEIVEFQMDKLWEKLKQVL